MIVKVKLFATLTQYAPKLIQDQFPKGVRSGTTFEIELSETSTLGDLVSELALPSKQVKITFVNGRSRKTDYQLNEGDEVGIFPPIGGG
jgi:molybdopterin converting factor small subunit